MAIAVNGRRSSGDPIAPEQGDPFQMCEDRAGVLAAATEKLMCLQGMALNLSRPAGDGISQAIPRERTRRPLATINDTLREIIP